MGLFSRFRKDKDDTLEYVDGRSYKVDKSPVPQVNKRSKAKESTLPPRNSKGQFTKTKKRK